MRAELTRHPSRRGDALFRWLAKSSGWFILALLVLIAAFLVIEAIPALQHDKSNFFSTLAWDPDQTGEFGIAALAFGSILSSLLALIIGVPIAVGVGLYISQYAPRAVARPLGYIVDLLAAVPSVVFGLWGLIWLVPTLIPLSEFLNKWLGWFPLFASSNNTYGKSMFAAGVVLAVMILPIVAALCREVFIQTPDEHIEAAYALGATRWEMIRMAVLPYGRSGMISAIVLGFGRAIGETIAVALVLSSSNVITFHIFDPAGATIAANVANKFGDAGATGRSALIASGLVLFAITLVVNFGARAIVRRGSKEKRA
ncbi:phosphate ABC transporter permease subunit PstC [Amycolatopsis alkalitolerans]|uniref:Phosphate transport system permease protein n=1 Tax=Amycolatopsis alkalitolerans TaxID=2547244 RepID=A0A5C4M672_9PSEU|nr:phosphate ABC transporter permease subunit PstC [Amycolatopsis alkalitolerans]